MIHGFSSYFFVCVAGGTSLAELYEVEVYITDKDGQKYAKGTIKIQSLYELTFMIRSPRLAKDKSFLQVPDNTLKATTENGCSDYSIEYLIKRVPILPKLQKSKTFSKIV